MAGIHFGYGFNLISGKIEKKNKLIEIKSNCVKFVVVVCKELQKRIPKNMKILESISVFAVPSSTSQLRPPIGDLVIHFKKVAGQENIDATVTEWRILPLENWNITNEESTESFWHLSQIF